jgi:hypothetical protein
VRGAAKAMRNAGVLASFIRGRAKAGYRARAAVFTPSAQTDRAGISKAAIVRLSCAVDHGLCQCPDSSGPFEAQVYETGLGQQPCERLD